MQKTIPTPAESAGANTGGTTGAMAGASTHWPSLMAAVMIMVIATLDPRWLAHPNGTADHLLASFLFLAMSAGFVRGVGFIPRWWLWRALFSGWTCALGLALAAAAKWMH